MYNVYIYIYTETFYGSNSWYEYTVYRDNIFYIQSHNFHRKLAHAHIWPSVYLFLFLIHHKDREQQPKVGTVEQGFFPYFFLSVVPPN